MFDNVANMVIIVLVAAGCFCGGMVCQHIEQKRKACEAVEMIQKAFGSDHNEPVNKACESLL